MDSGIWDEIRGKLGFASAGSPMLIGMAAVLVLVAVASAHVLSGAATASNLELQPMAESAAVEDPGESATLFVHVSGCVCSPGLYELGSGARVADAVNAAGGFSDNADTGSCNLARILQDGEQVFIGAQTDVQAEEGVVRAPAQTGGKININTADAGQLETLPGIGKATAAKIVDDRTANGPFKTVEELTRVSGIGEKKLASIIDLICV